MRIEGFFGAAAAAVWSLLFSPLAAWGQTSFPRTEEVRPDFVARDHQTEYNGPGREEPAPEGLKEVRIGYFGPSDPDHPEGGDLWLAASLAIEEGNQEGGYRGTPFRLVPVWSENRWGTGIARLARLVYSEGIWAIIGSIDGESTHLAEQVAAKARVTVINPAATDKTVHLANVPWMFSCPPGDHRLAEVLAQGIRTSLENQKDPTLLLVSSTDHDSRAFTTELLTALARNGTAPAHHLQVDPRVEDFVPLGRQIAERSPKAVAIMSGPRVSAGLLLSLRSESFPATVFGGPWMARRGFLECVGSFGEGAVFPLLCSPSASQSFAQQFTERYGRVPDYACLHTYDATRLLIHAVRKAGLNRARIRDAVAGLSPWEGASGMVAWDRLGQNERPVGLGTLRAGRVVALGLERKPEAKAR